MGTLSLDIGVIKQETSENVCCITNIEG